MTRKEFPGGWYCDALPSGEFAVLFADSHIQTDKGRIELPVDKATGQKRNPLYLRITNIGGFQIAGQDNTPAQWCWHYVNGEWHQREASVGTSPVIFDNQGKLHISNGSVGSQGYRYVAPGGQLVTGDNTYGSSFGLSEWTDLGGLIIGQSISDNQDNAWVWDGTNHHLLEPGPCRFIRDVRAGEKVSSAIWKPKFGAVILFTTMGELKALPLVPKKTTPPPVIEPAPKPIPIPMPSHTPVPERACAGVIEHVRDGYTAPLGAKHAQFLAEVVDLLNETFPNLKFGLFKKSGGTFIVMPSGEKVSQDIVAVHQGNELWVYDILGSGETKARPMFDPTGDHNSGDPNNDGIEPDVRKFYAVQEVDRTYKSAPVPVPPAEPTPPPQVPPPSVPGFDPTPLLLKIAELEKRILAVEQKPAPQFQIVVDDTPGAPSVSTSKDYYHAHRIALKVVPK